MAAALALARIIESPSPDLSIEARVCAIHDLLMMAVHNVSGARDTVTRILTSARLTQETIRVLIVPVFQWVTNVFNEPLEHPDLPAMDLAAAQPFVRSLFLRNKTFWQKIFAIPTEHVHSIRMAMTLMVYLMTNMYETPDKSVVETMHWITEYTTPTFIRDHWIMPNLQEKASDRMTAVSQTEALVLLGSLAPMHGDSLDVSECFEALIPIMKSLDLDTTADRSIAMNGIYAFLNWLHSTKDKFDAIRPIWPSVVTLMSHVLLRSTSNNQLEKHGECVIRYMLRCFANFGVIVANDVARVLTLAHPWVFRRESPMEARLRTELVTGLFEDIAKHTTVHGYFKAWLRAIKTSLTDHYVPSFSSVPVWYWKIMNQIYDVDREFLNGYLHAEVIERLVNEIELLTDRLESNVRAENDIRIERCINDLIARVPVLSIYVFEDSGLGENMEHLNSLNVFRLIKNIYKVLDDRTLWARHGRDINTLRVNAAGVRYVMLKRSTGAIRSNLWHELVGPWIGDTSSPASAEAGSVSAEAGSAVDVPIDSRGPEYIVDLVIDRYASHPFTEEDASVLAPLMTMVSSMLEDLDEYDSFDLDRLIPVETSIIKESEHYGVVKIFLFWLCQSVSHRKNNKNHPLMLMPFWELRFEELRPILAQWQSVAIIRMLPDGDYEDMLTDFNCDFASILQVFEEQEPTNYEARVYILQFVAVCLMTKLYDEEEADHIADWVRDNLLVQIRQGSWESLILLQCIVQWGLSIQRGTEFTDAIREAFIDKMEGTDAEKIKVVEDMMKSFLRTT